MIAFSGWTIKNSLTAKKRGKIMIKTKKKYLIISLLTVIFTAVICAFTIQTPQAVHAADSVNSTFKSSPDTSIIAYSKSTNYAYISADVDLNYKTNSDVEDNAVFVAMMTTDYAKYSSVRDNGIHIRCFSSRATLGNNKLYSYTKDKIREQLSVYCDDFQMLSKGVSFNDYMQIDFNFLRVTEYIVGNSHFELGLPTNLNKPCYVFCVKLFLTKTTEYLGGSTHSPSYYENFDTVSVSDCTTISSVAVEMYKKLEDINFDDASDRKCFQKALGIYREDGALQKIKVKYQTCTGFATFEDVTKEFSVDPLYMQSSKYVIEEMYKQLNDVNGIEAFNCVYTQSKYIVNEKGSQTYVESGQKIVRQAKDFTYVYSGTSSGTLTVNYEPFIYSNFAIRVKNNGENKDLVLDMYSADVKTTGSYYVLTFTYADLNKWLLNKIGWLVDLKADSFTITNNSASVKVVAGADALTVTFEKDKQDELLKVNVTASALITEDVKISYRVQYSTVTLNDKNEVVVSTENYTDIVEDWYSKFQNTADFVNLYNENSSYYELLNSAVSPEFLGEVKYYIPSSANVIDNYGLESWNYTIKVGYSLRTLISVKVNDKIQKYVQLDKTDGTYTLDDLSPEIPAGSRISKLSCSEGLKSNFDEANVSGLTVMPRVQLDSGDILDVNFTTSSTWLVRIEYLENCLYTDTDGKEKPSGLAIKKTYDGEVAYILFPDLAKAIVPDESLLKVLDKKTKDDLTVIGTFGAYNGSEVTKEGDKYIIKLQYGRETLKVIQSDGEHDLTNVPISCFGDWAKSYGKDWEVRVLNTVDNSVSGAKEKIIFRDNTINPNDIYGYFYVALFQERVKNFDELFAGYSAGGCRTFFSAKKVQGSSLYKFCDSMGLIGALITHGGSKVYQAVEESFREDSGTYYSYFMYIDGSSSLNFAANNKANDYFNNKSAFENTLDQAKEDLSTWWNSNNDVVKGIKALLGVLLIVGVAICIIYLIPVFAGGIGKASKAITQVKNDTKNKGGAQHERQTRKRKKSKKGR